jgi:glycosyltransferase involved in cell wall biosynthesis
MAIPPKSAPLVVTVHDLAFLQDPAHFTRHGLRFFNRGLALVRNDADLVLVPSRASWQECVDAGIEKDRLRLVPHGVQVPAVSTRQVDEFRTAHGLSERYVLWCGTLEPRKNVPGLLRAFAIAHEKDPNLELVLAGPNGWGDVEVPQTDGVRLLGFLPSDELHAAYAGARAFCYPSFREGFGLPVLEAMAHGVPVVTSAGTAMAEFTEGAGLLVDAHDVEGIANAVVVATDDRHGELAAASLSRSRDYTWENSATLTLAAYHEVAGR